MKINIKQPKWMVLFIATLNLTLIFPYNAVAYIDPNTGGFFFASVLPFVYGIFATVVIFWKRIANTVKNIFSLKKETNES